MPELGDALCVGVAQPLAYPGDVRENLRRMAPLVDRAADHGAQLVVFSECGLTGYDLDERALAARFPADAPVLDEVQAMAARSGAAIMTGFFEQATEGIYNTAVAIAPDGSRVYQRKHVAGEGLRAGPRTRAAFECHGLRLAMVICADDRVADLYDELAEQRFDAAVLMTAGCGRLNSAYRRAELDTPAKQQAYLDAAESVCFPRSLVERAERLGMGFVAVNQAGHEPELNFFHPGHSSIVDHDGRLQALIPGRFLPEQLKPEIAVGTLRKTRP